jgi:hypothetical protein
LEAAFMDLRIRVLAVVLLAAAAGAAPAASGVLDLIPEDAAAAIAVRNLNELKTKGDKFAADAELQHLPRPSMLFDMLLDGEGLRAGADLDGSFAFVMANPEILGAKLFDDNGNLDFRADFMSLFVLAVAVKDRDALAANFGIAKGALKPDTPVEGKGKSNLGRFFCLHGKHLFYGNSAKVVRSVATSPRAGSELAAARRRPLERADLLVHLRRQAIAPVWKDMLKEMEKGLLEKASQEEDKKAVAKIIETLAVIRTSWVGIRLDDGLGVSWVNTFPREGIQETRQFLASLGRGSGVADLAGLPDGRVLAAESLRGDGSRNAAIARVFYAALWDKTMSGTGWLSPADRANHLGVFTEIWKHLKGSRVAVYHNANRARDGLLSAVGILDTADAEQFLKELRLLARLGGDDLDLSEKTGKDDVAAVEKLIRELGDDAFAVRESATRKLALIGEAALPQLEKALTSSDPEVRRRAAEIKETIVATAVEHRKELLDKNALKHVHPVFGFSRKGETLDGTRVEVVRVRLTEKDPRAAANLREIFGPDWDRIRLAIHGRQVVVLLGSNQDLLRAALTNLKEGKRGLADAKPLAGATAHANPERRAELHLSLGAAQAFWTGADLENPKGAGPLALTSFAVTVDPDFLELDVWVPPAEAKVIEKAGGF